MLWRHGGGGVVVVKWGNGVAPQGYEDFTDTSVYALIKNDTSFENRHVHITLVQ